MVTFTIFNRIYGMTISLPMASPSSTELLLPLHGRWMSDLRRQVPEEDAQGWKKLHEASKHTRVDVHKSECMEEKEQ